MVSLTNSQKVLLNLSDIDTNKIKKKEEKILFKKFHIPRINHYKNNLREIDIE